MVEIGEIEASSYFNLREIEGSEHNGFLCSPQSTTSRAFSLFHRVIIFIVNGISDQAEAVVESRVGYLEDSSIAYCDATRKMKARYPQELLHHSVWRACPCVAQENSPIDICTTGSS